MRKGRRKTNEKEAEAEHSYRRWQASETDMKSLEAAQDGKIYSQGETGRSMTSILT